MDDPLSVLWGKSNAAGRSHLLVAHLLDSAAVGEQLWDQFLAPTLRADLDRSSGGRGRALLALLCGLHDIGKATPVFQSKDSELRARVVAAGLPIRTTKAEARQWHHTLAGARILRDAFEAARLPKAAADWVWPLIAGHHGRVPGVAALSGRDRSHGGTAWRPAQFAAVSYVTTALDTDLGLLATATPPTRARQLALAGVIIMADWIASNDQHFPGLPELPNVSLGAARQRAAAAVRTLGLRGGWGADSLAQPDDPDIIALRWDNASRPLQEALVAAAEVLPAPGLVIVEAPMGEGKTEAALAAVEVLSRRFGADGAFVGMPTQATSDPMFSRVLAWLERVDPTVPVALLHGRSRFNPEWVTLREQVRFRGIGDRFGMADEYGSADYTDDPVARPAQGVQAAAEWFLGRKRGLLSPVTVGTVDHLLHAATRTRHVMLRFAGLAGRVVVLDEVHAYDVYMSQFLQEALRWLADARVPVVLLSATLPPDQRRALVRAYVQGASLNRDVQLELPTVEGYPRITAVPVQGPVAVSVCESWRGSTPVQVDLVAESEDFAPEDVAATVLDSIRSQGCALVVCNTVRRAQAVYRLVREELGSDAVLLHAQLTAASRGERSRLLVDRLGPQGDRPSRLAVVATQVAEQSLDIDADVLVTDLAPIDLLLQRVGRLHRHDGRTRPTHLSSPRVLVSGVRFGVAAPTFPGGSRAVYGEYLLLRAAALVREALESGWSIPADVPRLVAEGYGDLALGPAAWADAVVRSRERHLEGEELRIASARNFLLAGPDRLGLPTLKDLHRTDAGDLEDDDAVAAVVRDGDESIEVVLVRQDVRGYRSLTGLPIGPQGEGISDPEVLQAVAGSTMRLPSRLTSSAKQLTPLSGWRQDPWLAKARALVLDDASSTSLGDVRIRYDDDLGLIVDRSGP